MRLSAEEDVFNIAVFEEKNLPYAGTPEKFNIDWLKHCLRDTGYNIYYINTKDIKDNALFNTDRIDLLILSYGEAVPAEAVPFIAEFIKDGGGLFTVAGKPFGCILRKEKDAWKKIKFPEIEKYTSGIGLYGYDVSRKDIASARKNSNILDMSFKMESPADNQCGVLIKTSERIYNVPPVKGNVFPFRIPARNFIHPFILTDNEGNYTGAPFTLVKSWRNPYKETKKIPNKWCLIGFRGENHPLNPGDRDSGERLKKILEYLSAKIILKGVETNYASYKEKEPIKISAKILNYGIKDKNVRIDFFVTGDDGILLREEKDALVKGQEEKVVSILLKPGKLEEDFYEVKAVLKINGRIVDEERNGFAVWHREKLAKGRRLTTEGKIFYFNKQPLRLRGVNYYESRHGGLMWVAPNISYIQRDLKTISESGMNFLRAHYHHPKWFRDYLKMTGLPLFSYFKNIADSPLPDEKSLRILDAFVILCGKYGIYFQPDLFTLVPEEMGDPGGWIGDSGRCKDSAKIKMQEKFVKIISKRYAGAPNIIWDLWNEPFLPGKDILFLKTWAEGMDECFNKNGDRHLVTLGSNESVGLADKLDFACGHGHEIKAPDINKPFLFQEVWNESDLTAEQERAQAVKLKKDFLSYVKQKGAGFAPWQWTRQACLWDDMGDPEKWDDDLGLCVREDGSLKPAGRLYIKLLKWENKRNEGRSR